MARNPLFDSVGALIQLGVSLTERGVDAGAMAIAKKVEERDAMVEVPVIYSSDYRLKLADATRWLEEDGFKVEAIIAQPDIEYKDCADLEVVASNYKLKQRVEPGTRIILRYVTSEVIEASQALFDEAERQKADTEQKKAEKQAKRAEKRADQAKRIKQNINKATDSVQSGFSKAVLKTQKGIDEIAQKRLDKRKLAEENDASDTLSDSVDMK